MLEVSRDDPIDGRRYHQGSAEAGLRARPFGNLGVPAPEVGTALGYRFIAERREIDDSKRRRVRDREARAGDEWPISKLRVELSEEELYTLLAPLDERRDLRDRSRRSGNAAVGEKRMLIAEDLGHREQPLLVRTPLPHVDDRALAGVDTHQRRIGIELLEVAADGH